MIIQLLASLCKVQHDCARLQALPIANTASATPRVTGYFPLCSRAFPPAPFSLSRSHKRSGARCPSALFLACEAHHSAQMLAFQSNICPRRICGVATSNKWVQHRPSSDNLTAGNALRGHGGLRRLRGVAEVAAREAVHIAERDEGAGGRGRAQRRKSWSCSGPALRPPPRPAGSAGWCTSSAPRPQHVKRQHISSATFLSCKHQRKQGEDTLAPRGGACNNAWTGLESAAARERRLQVGVPGCRGPRCCRR